MTHWPSTGRGRGLSSEEEGGRKEQGGEPGGPALRGQTSAQARPPAADKPQKAAGGQGGVMSTTNCKISLPRAETGPCSTRKST